MAEAFPEFNLVLTSSTDTKNNTISGKTTETTSRGTVTHVTVLFYLS
jgi:hypothetical protein